MYNKVVSFGATCTCQEFACHVTCLYIMYMLSDVITCCNMYYYVSTMYQSCCVQCNMYRLRVCMSCHIRTSCTCYVTMLHNVCTCRMLLIHVILCYHVCAYVVRCNIMLYNDKTQYACVDECCTHVRMYYNMLYTCCLSFSHVCKCCSIMHMLRYNVTMLR